jgi:Swt1-like HEPN
MTQSASKKPSLRAALVAKLGHPTRFQLRGFADGARKRFGQMSLLDAYAVLAAERGIRLDKYLVEPDLGRVRGIMATRSGAGSTPAPIRNGQRPRAKTETRLKEIVIDGARFVPDDPILPAAVMAQAGRMAEVYPLTYVFENSVREFVLRVMEKKHGKDWFKQPYVTSTVLSHVAGNKKNEAAVPWHAARGVHDIHYTSIEDLLAIMFTVSNNRPVFEAIVGKETGVRHLVEIIETARHAIAHHRPLPPEEIQRLKLNVRAWHKLMRERKHLIG